MPHILLKDVGVSIPIYNSQGRSLKKTIMGMASAGRIGLTEKGVTVVQSLNHINLTVKSKELGLLEVTVLVKAPYFVS